MIKKGNILRWSALLPILLIFSLSACDSTTGVDSLEDSLSQVPNLNLIEGAENVEATVNKNRDRSYFTVNLSGMAESSGIEEGHYASFCAMWDVPIQSDNDLYSGTKMHSISGEPYWKKVNYIVNNMDRYYQEMEDLTWLELQIALWSVMDHKPFDLESIPESDLPSEVRNGDYNIELINEILSDAEENSDDFNVEAAVWEAHYLEIEGAQDQIVIIPGGGDLDKGFGVRFKSFAADNNNGIYLGVGDLGVESNRSQIGSGYIYKDGINTISFEYDADDDLLRASANGYSGVYTNLSAGIETNTNCTIEEIDRANLYLVTRHEGASVTTTLSSLGLTESVTSEYGDGWIIHGVKNIDISSGFEITGTLDMNGFTDQVIAGGDELSKLELLFGCPKDDTIL